ncbi:MAG TPA: aminoglycoside phosphotransferase family protein [Chloroflexi bacterium]|nr:aminoglycoside phosphotransferase family protein [Chloroflexota bacterium]
MAHDQGGVSRAPVLPPADVPEIQRGNYFTVPGDDPVLDYLATRWEDVERPAMWEAARLSQATYIYRETSIGRAIVAKFYSVKTGDSAEKHARREFEMIRQARAAGLADGGTRAIQPWAVWRGVLFLEYVDGLTLEDAIAVRRSRPGRLSVNLSQVAALLATLHSNGARPETPADFEAAAAYAREVLEDLSQYGVIQDDPITREGLLHSIDWWADRPEMQDFAPTLIHGDATTSNFIFPGDGGVVAVDWERLETADPAADLGRLMAEVLHSVTQHGGSASEGTSFVQYLTDVYRRALPGAWDVETFLERACFYQASSMLRIARNGWVSRLDRTALIARALALLARRGD